MFIANMRANYATTGRTKRVLRASRVARGALLTASSQRQIPEQVDSSITSIAARRLHRGEIAKHLFQAAPKKHCTHHHAVAAQLQPDESK